MKFSKENEYYQRIPLSILLYNSFFSLHYLNVIRSPHTSDQIWTYLPLSSARMFPAWRKSWHDKKKVKVTVTTFNISPTHNILCWNERGKVLSLSEHFQNKKDDWRACSVKWVFGAVFKGEETYIVFVSLPTLRDFYLLYVFVTKGKTRGYTRKQKCCLWGNVHFLSISSISFDAAIWFVLTIHVVLQRKQHLLAICIYIQQCLGIDKIKLPYTLQITQIWPIFTEDQALCTRIIVTSNCVMKLISVKYILYYRYVFLNFYVHVFDFKTQISYADKFLTL